MELHYVYYAIKKDGTPKVGATKSIKKRADRTKYLEIIPLEIFECPWKCGDKEIELQLHYFGKRDSKVHYAVSLKSFKKASELNKGKKRPKEVIAKMTGRPKGQNEMFQGELNNASKFTEEDIKFIRDNHFKRINQSIPIPKGKMSGKQLAEMFNVNQSAISKVVNNLAWTHVK